MKFGKKTLAFLAIATVALTVGFVLFYDWLWQLQFAALEDQHGDLAPYIDIGWLEWPYNFAAILGMVLLSVVWLVFIFLCVKTFGRTRMVAAAAATLLMIPVVVGPVFADPPADVPHMDIWVLEDDPNRNPAGDPTAEGLFDNYFLPFVTMTLAKGLGIYVHWHKWTYWDSDDSTSDIYGTLTEACDEMGWYWGKEVDGEPIEFMLVVSVNYGWKLNGSPVFISKRGCGPPWLRALIVGAGYSPLEIAAMGGGTFILHELGHEFGLEHHVTAFDTPTCIMNSQSRPPPILPPVWTGLCQRHAEQWYENINATLYSPPTEPRNPPPRFIDPNDQYRPRPESDMWLTWLANRYYLTTDGDEAFVYFFVESTSRYGGSAITTGCVVDEVAVGYFTGDWTYCGERHVRYVRGERIEPWYAESQQPVD